MATGNLHKKKFMVMARGEAECFLNCCKCNFYPCTLIHMITYYSSWLTFTKHTQSQPYNLKGAILTQVISSEPMQFEVSPCNLK